MITRGLRARNPTSNTATIDGLRRNLNTENSSGDRDLTTDNSSAENNSSKNNIANKGNYSRDTSREFLDERDNFDEHVDEFASFLGKNDASY